MALGILRTAARDIARDLGSAWISSLITRIILCAVAGALGVAALGFLIAAAQAALATAIGPVYANLVLAGGLIVLTVLLLVIIRVIARRAARRRKLAMAQAVAALAVMKSAAGTAAGDHAGKLMLAALLLGLLAGRAVFSGVSGDDADEDEKPA